MSGSVCTRRILLVVTSGLTAKAFVLGFARYLASLGHSVGVIADSLGAESTSLEPVQLIGVQMKRDPTPVGDIRSLIQLIREVRSFSPDVIAYATPKAALLASIVGRFLRVPVRIYQLWGLRLETVSGWRRQLLAIAERVTSHNSTSVLANSQSLADMYLELRLSGTTPVRTLGEGSSHGVDLDHFSPSADLPPLDTRTSAFLKAHSGLTVGFVGRLHPDKGLDTLLEAAAQCGGEGTQLRIILVGSDEGADHGDHLGALPNTVSTHLVGRISDPRPYYAAMDVLVLVSRREGFPNVVLEAAAMGVPAIVSDATGAVDSVANGETGMVVPVDDAPALANCLTKLAADRAVLQEMGSRARAHVERAFSQDVVWARHANFFVDRNDERKDLASK